MKRIFNNIDSIYYFIAATFLIILGSSARIMFHFPLAPLYGLPVILIGMLVGKKGIRLQNIEKGKQKNYETQKTKFQIQFLYYLSIFFLLLAVVAMYYSLKK